MPDEKEKPQPSEAMRELLDFLVAAVAMYSAHLEQQSMESRPFPAFEEDRRTTVH